MKINYGRRSYTTGVREDDGSEDEAREEDEGARGWEMCVGEARRVQRTFVIYAFPKQILGLSGDQ